MRTAQIAPLLCLAALALTAGTIFAADRFLSHPPMRPLPAPSDRALADGSAYFADARQGDDANDGSKAKPWRSVNHALRQLKPGDTLYLRAGTYYEHVVVPHSGEEGRPITLRSYPGELAVIDGGLREFFEQPGTAWTAVDGGASHEFVSVKPYPQFNQRPVLNAFMADGWEPFYGIEDQRPLVLGHFGDSMVPLHGYRTLRDFRDDSMLWDVTGKKDEEHGVYCGPGLWYNRQTQRIHIRLAPTTLDRLGEHAYRGAGDPRKLPLVISGPCGDNVLRINGVRHFQLQDIVLRGASGSPLINLYGSDNISLDGITVYGGSPGLLVKATSKLSVANCAFRGLAAPWSSRASMKYRGTPSYIVIADRNQPENHDFEFAHNEFTDDHDFAFVRFVKNLRFHHNYVDNFNDDGLEVGAKKRDQEIYVYQNLFSRCLTTFTLHEIDRDESPAEVNPDSGVYITRNVIDLRRGTFKGPPREANSTEDYLNEPSRVCGDHGGPVWPHYYFYHNTLLAPDTAWRSYYGFGMGVQGTRSSLRRVFNNMFVQLRGLPGLAFTSDRGDVLIDGNLHWGVEEGPKYTGDFFAPPVKSKQVRPPEEWLKHDLFADPRFAKLGTDPAGAFDVTLRSNSPAIDKGVIVPETWFDPLRAADRGPPDIGAFPLGVEAWPIGARSRLTAFGSQASP